MGHHLLLLSEDTGFRTGFQLCHSSHLWGQDGTLKTGGCPVGPVPRPWPWSQQLWKPMLENPSKLPDSITWKPVAESN